MSKRLDDLSRNLASGMSRRRALQIFAGGLVAAAFGRSAIGVEAAKRGDRVTEFCQSICSPYFTGRRRHRSGDQDAVGDYHGNYYGNYYANYYGNSSTYDQCIDYCHRCDPGIYNPCGSDICVQAEFPGQPVRVYCLNPE